MRIVLPSASKVAVCPRRGSIHCGSGKKSRSKLLNPSVVDRDWGTTVTQLLPQFAKTNLAPPVRMKRPLPLSEVMVVCARGSIMSVSRGVNAPL